MKHTTKPTVIVVVEDDPDTRYIFQAVLEPKYTVHIADTISPEELIALQADIVFMDLLLKGQSGADLCRLLKSDPATKAIPVILCSAANSLPAIKEQCNADACIAKPFDIDDLYRAVEAFADSKRLGDIEGAY